MSTTNLEKVQSMNCVEIKQFILDCNSCKTCAFTNECDHSQTDKSKCHRGIFTWMASNSEEDHGDAQ